MSDSLWPHGLQPTKLLCPWNFPGKNTGVGCHFLLRGIFPTQESSPHSSLPSPALAGGFFTTSTTFINFHIYISNPHLVPAISASHLLPSSHLSSRAKSSLWTYSVLSELFCSAAMVLHFLCKWQTQENQTRVHLVMSSLDWPSHSTLDTSGWAPAQKMREAFSSQIKNDSTEKTNIQWIWNFQ